MRKAYAKPILYAESFELVEHISKGCGSIANFGTGCGIEADGVTYFANPDICGEDGISMIKFHYNTDDISDKTVEDLIAMNVTCYNSNVDLHTLFCS